MQTGAVRPGDSDDDPASCSTNHRSDRPAADHAVGSSCHSITGRCSKNVQTCQTAQASFTGKWVREGGKGRGKRAPPFWLRGTFPFTFCQKETEIRVAPLFLLTLHQCQTDAVYMHVTSAHLLTMTITRSHSLHFAVAIVGAFVFEIVYCVLRTCTTIRHGMSAR